MSQWQPIETAPKDGRWIVLDVEWAGDIFGAMVGRWRPEHYPDLGTYEWEVIDNSTEAGIFNHYSEGRVGRWQPLPL